MKKNTHFAFGFITALIMIITGVALHALDLSFEPWAQWVTNGIFFIGILANAISFSKANDGYVSFGNVFSSGFKASAIITLCMLVWSFISIMIFPDIVDRALERSAEQMSSRGLSDDQIDQTMEMTRNNFRLFMAMGVVFGSMFFGAVFSLIGALIAKKKGNGHQHVKV